MRADFVRGNTVSQSWDLRLTTDRMRSWTCLTPCTYATTQMKVGGTRTRSVCLSLFYILDSQAKANLRSINIQFQPNMIIYALRALLNALAPLIGAEMESGKAVVPGWANSDTATPEKLKEWTELGLGIKDEMERIAQQTTADEYGRLMRKVRRFQNS